MDRRQFLKFLAQSSASVGATVFVERVWGFPTVAAFSRNNNKIFFWGAGILNTTTTSSPPVSALTPTKFFPRYDFSSIEVTGSFTHGNIVGITKKGDILTWGDNVNFQQGPIQGTIGSPVLFGTITPWSQVSIGNSHGAGVRTNGTLWTWGYNIYGQLGDGTTVTKSTPIQIGSSTIWVSAIAGYNATFALQTGGTLWAWGANNNQNYLGNGTATSYFSSPTQVGSANSWTKISGSGGHVLGIKTDGSLWSWGNNYDYRLGNGTNVASASPVPVIVPILNSWSNVCAAGGSSYAIKTDGTLWAWGYNPNGELGIGTVGDVSTPVQIGSASNWASLRASFEHTIALKTDGTIWGWGSNHKGQLGNGTTLAKPAVISTPIQIGSGTSWVSIGAVNDINGNASFGLRTK